jgi:hypothetical protein
MPEPRGPLPRGHREARGERNLAVRLQSLIAGFGDSLPASTPPSEDAARPLSLEHSAQATRASLALHNLRGVAVALVVMTHSSLAYVASADSTGAFDRPPYQWLAFPVLDPSRSLGFDIFCAWQDAYLMALWFFLSGVFTWPSLERSGTKQFLAKRVPSLAARFCSGSLR